MRRRRAAALVAAVAALLLVCFGAGWFPQGTLRTLLEEKLWGAFATPAQGSARIGSLHVVPFLLSLELGDVALTGSGYAFEATRVRLGLSPAVLLGRLDLRFLELEEPRVTLGEPTDDAGSRSELRPPPLRIARLAVSRGLLRYRFEALGGELLLEGIDVDGSVGAGALEITTQGGAWLGPEPTRLGAAQARLSVSPRLDLRLLSFDGGTVASRVRAAGELGRPGSIRPRLQWQASVDLADLGTAMGMAPASGTVAGKGRVSSSAQDVLLQGSFDGEDLHVLGWRADEMVGELQTEGDQGSAKVGLSALGGTGSAEVRRDGATAQARIRVEGLDLERLRERLAPGSPPVTGRLDGRLSLERTGTAGVTSRGGFGASAQVAGLHLLARGELSGQLRGPGDGLDLAWSAEIEAAGSGENGARLLRSGRLAARGSVRGAEPVVEGRLDGSLSLETGAGAQEMAFRGTFRHHGPGTTVDIRARGLGGTVHARAELRGNEARQLLLEAQGLRLSLLVPDATGVGRARFEAAGPLDRLSGSGTARVEGLAWRGVELGSVTARVESEAAVSRISVDVPAWHANAVGNLDSEGLRGRVRLAETPLGRLAALLPEGLPLGGKVSGSLDYDLPFGLGEHPEIQAQVASLELASGSFSVSSRRPFGLALDGNTVRVENLELVGSGFQLEASGTLGGADASTEVLRGELWADLGQLPVPESWELTGSVGADVTLGGTFEEPRASGWLRTSGATIVLPGAPPLVLADGRIELGDRSIVFPGLAAELAGGSVTLSGRVPFAALLRDLRADPGQLAEDEEAQLELVWVGVQARDLIRDLLPGGAADLSASLHGRADLRGGLASASELSGTITVPETALVIEDRNLRLAPFQVGVTAGRVQAREIALSAEEGTLVVGGTLDLEQQSLDLRGRGRLGLRALSPFLSEASLTGVGEVDVSVGGTIETPLPRGTLTVSDGTFRIRDLPQAITEIDGKLSFDETSVRIEEASAVLGGGRLSLTGTGRLSGLRVSDVAVKIAAREVLLRYPEGMRSRLHADLSLSGEPGAFLLSGEVRARRARYDVDEALEESLLAQAVDSAPSPLLRSFGLDVRVETDDPAIVRSSLAEDVRGTGTLTIRGDLESPALFGRLEVLPGGRLSLREHEFTIESGSLVYDGSWDPALSLEAVARVTDEKSRKRYRITLRAAGSLEDPRLSFPDGSGLRSNEIVGLLVMGSIEETAATDSAWIVGEQAASLLTSRLTRSLSSGLEGLGIDEVSIRPELLARETELGARFTFGKRLSPHTKLVYSHSLTDPESRFVQVDAEPGRRIELLGQRRDDGSLTFGAGQRLRLGGGRSRSTDLEEEKTLIQELRFEGERPWSDASLRSVVRARPGRRLSRWDLQEDADRLREKLREKGYLEAEVGALLQGNVAVFRLWAGPEFSWRVEGMSAPPDLAPSIHSALFEEEALENGRLRLLEVLHERGHLRAEVRTSVVEDGHRRRLTFSVEPGTPIEAEVGFPGARVFSGKRLLAEAGGPATILLTPERAVAAIREAYRRHAYLGVDVAAPRIQETPGRVQIAVPIREGARARIAAIRFEGASLSGEELRRVARIEAGSGYDEDAVLAAVQRIRGHYLELGYPAVRAVPRVETVDGNVELTFQIAEGELVTVGSVEISGLSRSRESIVRRQIPLQPGDALDPRKLARAERRLLDLGPFSRAAMSFSPGSPSTVHVKLEEEAPILARYQLRYNDERGASGELEAEVQNLFGRALALGGRYSRGAGEEEVRGSLHIPSLLGRGDLTLSFSRLREQLPGVDIFTGEAIENSRIQNELQAQQRLEPWRRWNLLLGYRFKRTTLAPTFPDPVDVAGVTLSLFGDTRDNPLDARRGHFLSLSLEYAPEGLGSDFTFAKTFFQVFVSRRLSGALTWAQGYRLGLGWGFGGQQIRSSERFKAGGGHSVRGFATESLGPTDFIGDPAGGEAVLILNQELRYHHPTGLGAALFYDAGNVFPRAEDLSLDLRHAVGVGLRWRSPVGLLRLDMGYPIQPQADERRYRVFFSLGQAF